MSEIQYINRTTRETEKEKVYGKFFIHALYGSSFFSKICSFLFLPLMAKVPLFSKLYGKLQKSHWSRSKIKPFIQTFKVDEKEFLDPVDSYQSFNDFFIRKLKPESRPFCPGNDTAILPADGRYLVFPHIHKLEGIFVKGHHFSLEALLQDPELTKQYREGSMVLARLCPTDYHRFHFPCNGIPEEPRLLNGPLYSVNPIALKKNIHILAENKRVITKFHTKKFGTLLYIDIGATYVGSIIQTFSAGELQAKGDEKGYFEFGGSSLILLFEPGKIVFDQDLIEASSRQIETKGLLGQSLGRALNL